MSFFIKIYIIIIINVNVFTSSFFYFQNNKLYNRLESVCFFFCVRATDLVVCVTEQDYVSIFFTHLWSVCTAMLLRCRGRLVTSLRFIFACHLVLYLYACAVKKPKISGFRVSEIRAACTNHKRVKKNETLCCSITQTTPG